MKVELLSIMGNDAMVVDVARVSYQKEASNFTEDQNKKLINYLATHKHWCYDEETEIFTNTGWKYFKDLLETDFVAEVYNFNDSKMAFVKPIQKYASFYSGDMILCESGTSNYCVTPNHKMLFKKRFKNGYIKDFMIDDAINCFGKNKYMLNSASIEPDLDIDFHDYYEGYYKAFLLCDGHKMNNSTISFRLKRDRKINSLRQTLNILEFDYKEKVTKDNVVNFIIKSNDAIWLQKGKEKCPNFNIFDKSYSYLKGMFDGFNNSDGSKKRNTFVFSSTSEHLINCYSNIATLIGYSVGKKTTIIRNGKHSNLYRVIALTRKNLIVNNHRRNDEKIIQYNGNIYCVTVNSGFILTRRNGKTLVCGNSPFSHPQLQFRLEIPIYVERQLVKSEAGRVYNSISGRYVDFSDTYTKIKEWRKQSKSSKQGSDGLIDKQLQASNIEESVIATCKHFYNKLIDLGVSKEQARTVLPLSLNTTMIWTGSLYTLIRLCQQRLKADAQAETREVVQLMLDEVKKTGLFVESLKAYNL